MGARKLFFYSKKEKEKEKTVHYTLAFPSVVFQHIRPRGNIKRLLFEWDFLVFSFYSYVRQLKQKK